MNTLLIHSVDRSGAPMAGSDVILFHSGIATQSVAWRPAARSARKIHLRVFNEKVRTKHFKYSVRPQV
jgi:hypothetical protein